MDKTSKKSSYLLHKKTSLDCRSNFLFQKMSHECKILIKITSSQISHWEVKTKELMLELTILSSGVQENTCHKSLFHGDLLSRKNISIQESCLQVNVCGLASKVLTGYLIFKWTWIRNTSNARMMYSITSTKVSKCDQMQLHETLRTETLEAWY